MNSKNKLMFIISLTLFQSFYLLGHYSTTYLDLFFLLTCLIAIFVYYCLYRIIIQLFIDTKTATEFDLLKTQQTLSAEQLYLIQQQKDSYLKSYTTFTETLQAIYTALNEQNSSKAKELTDNFLADFQHTRLHPYCEDNLILAILDSKRLIAEQSNIQVDYQIILPESSIIESPDLSSVLFNLLDNAIDACRISGIEKPFLSLHLSPSKGFLAVIVKNSKNPHIPFMHSTTKTDAANHGLGLSIVEDICRKYDGSYQWNDRGDIFESVVLLRYCK